MVGPPVRALCRARAPRTAPVGPRAPGTVPAGRTKPGTAPVDRTAPVGRKSPDTGQDTVRVVQIAALPHIPAPELQTIRILVPGCWTLRILVPGCWTLRILAPEWWALHTNPLRDHPIPLGCNGRYPVFLYSILWL